MFSEKTVVQMALPATFLRVRPLTYGLHFESGNVRHFLYFSRWGDQKRLLTAIYGFGQLDADNFAASCLVKYGGEVYRRLSLDCTNEVLIKISLGRLAGWQPRDSIDILNAGNEGVTNVVRTTVSDYVQPIVETIRTGKDVLRMLLSDVKPFPWALTNGAARAAQIIYLAVELGTSTSDIRKNLQKFNKYIAAQIPRDLNAMDYVDEVLEEKLMRQA